MTRHVAGFYVDGVQRCSKCMEVLIDRREEQSTDGQDKGGFAEGSAVLKVSGFVGLDPDPDDLATPECIEDPPS